MVAGICQGLAAMRCECILDGDWKSYRMRLEENIRERIQYMKMKNLTPEQLQHQQKLKENRDKLKERKSRTHKLIVRGAIAEAAIPGAIDMTDEEFQRALFDAIGRSGDTVPCSPRESRGSDPR